jgi:Tfp pilus assembly protein PilX
MATANKSTGLQIALVFTVMATIIALVVAFLQYKRGNERDEQLTAEKAERTKVDGEYRVAMADVQTLKDILGWPNTAEVGKPQQEGDATVIGQCKKLLAEVLPGDTPPTVEATLHRLDADLNSVRQERGALKDQTLKLNDRIAALQGEYQKLVDAHEKARRDAEKDLNEAQASKENTVKEKEKELADRQAAVQELQATTQRQTQEMAQYKETSKKQTDNLEKINRDLRVEKERVDKASFEVPSGYVQLVDLDTKLVWINRGGADSLRKGTTFSVYKQINKGVARGSQDIKGAIEVTRIVGPHQAEARITRARIDEPIVAGDPIYTPLWRPGVKERFAVVGIIDLDNDGVSDRDVLHELVAASNGEIIDEVDDQGIRHPPQGAITVATKFLVIGKIPDYSQSRADQKEAHSRISALKKKMVDEAMENGVRVVSMEDFLNYIGYDAGRRIWRPGITEKWNLRSGGEGNVARPGSTIRQESGGTTSGVFSGKGNPRRESSGVRTPAGQ